MRPATPGLPPLPGGSGGCPPGPAPSAPYLQARQQGEEDGGIVTVRQPQGHGQGQARRRHQGARLAPLTPPEAVYPYRLPPFLASMVVASAATALPSSRPAG
jgi:hypothetical protein